MEVKFGLKKFRERMRWNQLKLAEQLGGEANQKNISTWERGVNPGLSVIKKLFELGATVEELFEIEYNQIHGLLKTETTNNEVLRQMKSIEKRINSRLEALEKKKPQTEAQTA